MWINDPQTLLVFVVEAGIESHIVLKDMMLISESLHKSVL
jgi:hypothetical protein